MNAPAKAELRFRDANGVRSLLIGAVRGALARAGHRTTASLSQEALQRMRPPERGRTPQAGEPGNGDAAPEVFGAPAYRSLVRPSPGTPRTAYRPSGGAAFSDRAQVRSRCVVPSADMRGARRTAKSRPPIRSSGTRRSERSLSPDGDALVVDQHATQRLVYERLKAASKAVGVASCC